MPHRDDYNEDVPRDIPYYDSTLEDVDFAVYEFIDDGLNINTKTNFFESRVSQYAKFNVGKKKEQTLTFDADF